MATATSIVREKDLEAYLVSRVNGLGGVTWKWSSPGHAGVPDRIVILGRKLGFLELKAPGKKPTALQRRELERLAKAHPEMAGKLLELAKEAALKRHQGTNIVSMTHGKRGQNV